jgi:hypothetical protein
MFFFFFLFTNIFVSYFQYTACPEILFVRRQKPERIDINENTRDVHVTFPGGCSEHGDEGSLYTGTQPDVAQSAT